MDIFGTTAEWLQKGLKTLGVDLSTEAVRALLAEPKERDHGDVAFPCFTLAKSLKKAPPQIASELRAALETEPPGESVFQSVEVAGPYLNFRVDKTKLAGFLVPQILSGAFLARRPSRGERVMIEYSQPNTHKAFHVGHARNVALGDALVRICEFAGYDVVAANYFGDEGTHVAKCLWYFRTQFQGEVPEAERGEFLGELYRRATLMLDLGQLTRVPMPGVMTARVSGKSPHPERDSLQVVKLEIEGDSQVSVVCGGSDYQTGDIVAYATVGSSVGGRRVEVATRSGVSSEGMILSEAELGLGSDKNKIHTFDPSTDLGVEVADLFRRSDVDISEDQSILKVWRDREAGVQEILQKLEAGDPEITALWRETADWSLDEFRQIYDWFGARFDHEFFESEVSEAGKEIVLEYEKRGIFRYSDGAIGIDLSEDKLPFFLLLRSNGTGLYSTKDLALAKRKFDDFGIDRSVYVVDFTQSLHFQQVFKTLERMGYERAKNCFHLAYGMVKLPEGKMSSRDGNVILFSQLRERLEQKIKAEFLDRSDHDWGPVEKREAARVISVATIRYGMLNQDPVKDIVFDLDEWTSKTGNTGPYILYAYTRTRAILAKAGGHDLEKVRYDLLTDELEAEVVWLLNQFAEVAERAALEYRPQGVCFYLYDLSRAMSRMYDKCPVVKAESDDLRSARLALVVATGLVIQAGLALIGIDTLERM